MPSLFTPPTAATSPPPLARLDPRVRIVAAVIFSVFVAAVNRFPTLGLALAAAIVAALLAGLSPGGLFKRLAPLNVFMLFLIVLVPLTAGGAPLVEVGPLSFSREGFSLAARVVLKGNAIMAALAGLLGTVDIIALGHALHHLRVPDKLTHLLLFTARYVDVLRREHRRLVTAMKVRGFRPRMSLHTYRTYGHLVGMLLVRSLDRSERVVAAMKCRGFRGRLLPAGSFLPRPARRALRGTGGSGARAPGVRGVAMADWLVRLENVSFAYGPDRPVLDGCDLRLAAGERVGLAGPTGSGKTTLLALIVGLLRPSCGQVEVLGKLRTREADFHEVRGRVGLLFQDADDQLFCPTVAEDVAFGPLNLGVPRSEVRQTVAEVLESLGIAGYEERITYKLSGGEKRLVALATVLAMRPEVLLLDEPTSGLDEPSTQRVTAILAGLPQAMLIVSHDRRFLNRLVSRAVTLCDGRLCPVQGADALK